MSLLLFGTAGLLIRNAKLQELVIGLFRDRLRAEQIFQIFRWTIIFGFALLLIATLLIAFGPMLDHYIVGRQTLQISETLDRRDRELSSDPALREMQLGNYPRSRQLYLARLGLAHDEQSIDHIRGYITATYYGQGLHREGLAFICNYYRRFAAGDYRYLFNIHAHLRKIALTEGREVAAAVARDYRDRCGRPDFSEIWAGIPLGVMEALHDGHSKAEAPGTFADEDRAFLTRILANEEWKRHLGAPAVQMYPFGLYMLDRYQEALGSFDRHDALLRELTLYDAGTASDEPRAQTRYLEQFLTEFPKSDYASTALRRLAATYAELGLVDAAYESIRRLGVEDREDMIDELTADETEKADFLIKEGGVCQGKNLYRGGPNPAAKARLEARLAREDLSQGVARRQMGCRRNAGTEVSSGVADARQTRLASFRQCLSGEQPRKYRR